MDEEEVEAVLRGELSTEIEVGFFVVHALLLIGNDLDGAALASCTLTAL